MKEFSQGKERIGIRLTSTKKRKFFNKREEEVRDVVTRVLPLVLYVRIRTPTTRTADSNLV